MKKKILILINSENYIRNYLETDAFKKIIKNFKCFFVFNSNDVVRKKKIDKLLKKKNIYYVKYSNKEMENFQKYLHKNFQLNKEKSKTVSYLTKVNLKIRFYYEGENLYFSILKFPLRFISWLKKIIKYQILKIFKKNLYIKEIHKKIPKICHNIQPDLLMYPLQDPHLMSFEFLQIKSKFKSIGLIDNWDNLSSRPTYELKPDFITVWGAQTKQHAIKFQKYNKKNILIAGTPRFERYFIERNKKLKSYF